MRSKAGSRTIAARLVRLRPAILLLILIVVCVVHYGFGSGRMAATACSPEAKASLEQIARAPADALDYRGRDPLRDCVTEFATPHSEEIRRILVLRDRRRCARDFCLTEIWAEHRVSGFSAGYPFFVFTRPTPAVDWSGPVPTLAFASSTSSGETPFRLVYSRMAALYLPIDRGGSPDPPNFRPMRFRAMETEGRMALFGNGDVASDTVRYLERAVRDHGIAPGSTIFLNSIGGDTAGGMALGRAIRRMGLRTDVARGGPADRPSELRWGECISACTFAFLGGTERRLHPASILAFHGPANMRGMVNGDSNEASTPLDAADARAYAERLRAYLREIGLNGGLADRILVVGPDRVCSLSRQELASWGVLQDPSAAPRSRPVPDPMDCSPSDGAVLPST